MTTMVTPRRPAVAAVLLSLPFALSTHVAARAAAAAAWTGTARYSASSSRRRTASAATAPQTALWISSFSTEYGRGAEIWPPGGGGNSLDDMTAAVRLEDSFPGGILPAAIAEVMESLEDHPYGRENMPSSRRGRDSSTARSNDAKDFTWQKVITAASPWLLGVVGLPCVRSLRPLDVLLVTFVTGYTVLLQRLSQTSRTVATSTAVSTNGDKLPLLPALPPQGHVPWSVDHPLGYVATHSLLYTRWLQLGVLVGMVAPATLLAQLAYKASAATATAFAVVARPLVLLAIQVVTEGVVRRQRHVTPLPIRIFVPVAYNTIRLGYLWQWAFYGTASISAIAAAGTGLFRLCAVLNLAYTALNLFGFLLPIAVIRYMRAHFMAVEASHVVTRSGMDSIF